MRSPTETATERRPERAAGPRRIPIRYGQANPPRSRGFLTTAPDSPDWLIEADATAVPSGRVYVVANFDDHGVRRRFKGVAVVLQQMMTWEGRMTARIEFEFTSTPQAEIAEILGISSERGFSVDPDDDGQVTWASLDPDPENDLEASQSVEAVFSSIAEAAVERITADEEHRESLDGETFREYSTIRWQRVILWSAVAGGGTLATLAVLFVLAWPFKTG
jgi:hypothetical protein